MTEEMPNSMDELYGEYIDGLDDDWRDVFAELVGQGKAPSSVRATIEYATTIKSQEDAADEWGCTTWAIRQLKDELIEIAPTREPQSASWEWQRATKIDYCRELADELGWEKGEHWRMEHGETPILTAKGWKSVHKTVCRSTEIDTE